METEITVPQLPENSSDATVTKIYVNEGQEVAYNQNIFDIKTDKVVLEVVSQAAGIIDNIQLSENEHVSANQLVIRDLTYKLLIL